MQVVHALAFAFAAQVFVVEPGVVHADTGIGLEFRGRVHRVVLQRQGRRQLFHVRQLAIEPRPKTFDRNGVLEGRCRQQLKAHVIGEHVGEGQPQLSVAVQRRFGARDFGAVQLQVPAFFVGRRGSGTRANNKITGLVGVSSEGDTECKREQGHAEQGLVHGGSVRA